jgi:hypothetical protein
MSRDVYQSCPGLSAADRAPTLPSGTEDALRAGPALRDPARSVTMVAR